MKNTVFSLTNIFAAAAIFLFAVSPVAASYGQYGEEPVQPGQQILVDKQVSEPGTVETDAGVSGGVYRDNLSLDQSYTANQRIVFKIITKNPSNVTLRNVTVTDTLPEYLDAQVGPGTYNSANRTITYTIDELAPGATDIRYIEAEITDYSKLPTDRSVIDQTNRVTAVTDGDEDSDTARYYIEKRVKGITRVPDTGAPLAALIALQATALGIGFYLKRKSA